jgi:hypothetical protein
MKLRDMQVMDSGLALKQLTKLIAYYSSKLLNNEKYKIQDSYENPVSNKCFVAVSNLLTSYRL